MKIEFTLIETNSNQRFYKSSVTLKHGYNRLQRRKETWDGAKVIERVKPEYHHLFKEEGFDIICISNASTHFEKLAFAAVQRLDGTCGRTSMQVEGVHTFLSYGGDSSTCWEDEKYLRLIARHNGFSQNNVSIVMP
jgi:hypothetical protein